MIEKLLNIFLNKKKQLKIQFSNASNTIILKESLITT